MRSYLIYGPDREELYKSLSELLAKIK